MTKRLTNDEFLTKLAAINQSIEPLSEYVLSSKKILVRCKTCGYTWNKTPNALLCGQGCPKCGHKKAAAALAIKRRKSPEQFAQELAAANKDVKLVGTYVDSKTKVEVECVQCGARWMAFPGNLLSGTSCSACAHERHRTKENDFVARLNEINPTIELVSGYTMMSSKATFKCLTCGHTWSAVPSSIIQGTGCPECAITSLSETHKKDPDYYATQFAIANPTLKLLSRYKGSDNPVDVECKVCGHTWSTSAGHLLGWTGCPNCAGNIQLTHDDFLERMRTINPSIIINGKYVNNHERVDVTCSVCGCKWSPTSGGLLSGQGCPSCADVLKKSDAQFLAELADVNTNVKPIEPYDGANNPIKVRCKTCGNVWSVRPHALLHGYGCPECSISRRAFFEHAILYAAREALGKDAVLARDKSAIGMELDVFVPSMKVAFEPGSWYYHESRVHVDEKKQKLCAEKGIKLYTIYTSYFGDEPAPAWSIATTSTLGSLEWGEAVETINRLFDDAGIPVDGIDWRHVYQLAIARSGRRTTEMFKDDLAVINPNIEVLGEYHGARNRVEVRCKSCGHIWNPSAGSILAGTGCPRCKAVQIGNRSRKTNEQFLEELKQFDAPITLLEDYAGYDAPIMVRCTKCSHEWSSRPAYLLKGHFCPACNGSQRKTHEEYVSEAHEVNPNVRILGKYVNYSTPIKTECLVCGHIWNTTPNNIMSGKGCPICGRKKCDEARNKTHEKFVEQLKGRNPKVEAVGTYKKAREKMEFRCVTCGHTWYATPDNILRGRGCPKCKYRKKG